MSLLINQLFRAIKNNDQQLLSDGIRRYKTAQASDFNVDDIPKDSINFTNQDGETLIYYAAKNGNISALTQLLDISGIDHQKPNTHGTTPINIASQLGKITCLKLLLERTPNNKINTPDNQGKTPISHATIHNRKACLKLLLDYKIPNANQPDKKGRTPIYFATFNNRLEILELLLQHTPPNFINIPGGKEQNSPVMLATSNRNEKILAALLKQIPARQINTPNKYGITPILSAVQNSNPTTVIRTSQKDISKELKAATVSIPDPTVKPPDDENQTPNDDEDQQLREHKEEKEEDELRLEEESDDDKKLGPTVSTVKKTIRRDTILELLLKYVPDNEIHCPSKKDFLKLTPIFIAAMHGNDVALKLLLKQPSANPRQFINDSTKPSALHAAAYKGDANCVEQLLKQQIPVNQQTLAGCTPLYFAAQEGHTGAVNLLCNRDKINVNLCDKRDKKTPLYIAAYGGHIEIVRILLNMPGIDVNKARDTGATPVFTTASMGHTDILKLLILHGANINTPCPMAAGILIKNVTPFQIAKANDHQKCQNILAVTLQLQSAIQQLKSGHIDQSTQLLENAFASEPLFTIEYIQACLIGYIPYFYFSNCDSKEHDRFLNRLVSLAEKKHEQQQQELLTNIANSIYSRKKWETAEEFEQKSIRALMFLRQLSPNNTAAQQLKVHIIKTLLPNCEEIESIDDFHKNHSEEFNSLLEKVNTWATETQPTIHIRIPSDKKTFPALAQQGLSRLTNTAIRLLDERNTSRRHTLLESQKSTTTAINSAEMTIVDSPFPARPRS